MQRKSNTGRSVPVKMIQVLPHRVITVAVSHHAQGREDFLLGRDAVMILKSSSMKAKSSSVKQLPARCHGISPTMTMQPVNRFCG